MKPGKSGHPAVRPKGNTRVGHDAGHGGQEPAIEIENVKLEPCCGWFMIDLFTGPEQMRSISAFLFDFVCHSHPDQV